MPKLSPSSRSKGGAIRRARSEKYHYRTLFEHLPYPVWLHDCSNVKAEFDKLREAGVSDMAVYLKEHPDEAVRLASLLRIVKINREGLSYFGASSKDELTSQTPLLHIGKSYDPLSQELTALFNGETRVSSEFEIHTPKGEGRVVLLNLVVLPEAVSTLSHVIVTFTDITQQRRVQEELRDIVQVPEENPAPVMRTESSGILVYANPASGGLMQTLGLRIGKPVTEPLSGAVNEALAGMSPQMVNVTCDEKIFAILVVPVPDGRHVNLYGRDVTVQVRFEESLRKKEEGYRTMVAHAEEPMILIELNGNITVVSPRLAHALRYTPEEMEGLYAPRLVDAADLVSIAQKFAEFRANAPLPTADTFRLQRRGGGSVWVTATATVVNFGEKTEKYLVKCELLDVPAAKRYY